MPKFMVEITETLQRVVEVEADTLRDAMDKVEEDYVSCKINLDSGDYIDYEISGYKVYEEED